MPLFWNFIISSKPTAQSRGLFCNYAKQKLVTVQLRLLICEHDHPLKHIRVSSTPTWPTCGLHCNYIGRKWIKIKLFIPLDPLFWIHCWPSPSLRYYLTHTWMEKRWFNTFPKRMCARLNATISEFELGAPSSPYEVPTITPFAPLVTEVIECLLLLFLPLVYDMNLKTFQQSYFVCMYKSHSIFFIFIFKILLTYSIKNLLFYLFLTKFFLSHDTLFRTNFHFVSIEIFLSFNILFLTKYSCHLIFCL